MRSSLNGNQLACPSSVDQMACRTPTVLSGPRQREPPSKLSRSGEKWIPEEGHAIGPIRALEKRARDTIRVVHVRRHYLRAQSRQRACLIRIDIAGDSACVESRPFGSAQIARTSPPPWAPVAPTTAMILESLMRSIVVRASWPDL